MKLTAQVIVWPQQHDCPHLPLYEQLVAVRAASAGQLKQSRGSPGAVFVTCVASRGGNEVDAFAPGGVQVLAVP